MKIETVSKSICSQSNLLILNAWTGSQIGNFTRSTGHNNRDSHKQLRGNYLPLKALNNNGKNILIVKVLDGGDLDVFIKGLLSLLLKLIILIIREQG